MFTLLSYLCCNSEFMKKLLSFLMACTPAVILFCQSPIILDENDFANGGNAYYIANADPALSFDVASTGADFTWDFSDLTPSTVGVTYFEDPTDTDPLYFFLWLSSDVAQQSTADVVNEFITIEDIFNFYKLDDEEFSQTGFAGTFSDIPLPIAYDNNEILYEFPSAYNDNSSSEAGFSISVPGFGGWSEHRSRTNENDGWGTITTPSGTYDVLRTKSEIAILDTFSFDIFEIPFAYTAIEYRWMAKNEGMPVLQINAQEVFGFETTTQVMYKTADVIDAITSNEVVQHLVVSPNPAADQTSIQFNSSENNDLLISITDVNGNILLEKHTQILSGKNSIVADLQTFSGGIYFISLYENNQLVASQKIIKKG